MNHLFSFNLALASLLLSEEPGDRIGESLRVQRGPQACQSEHSSSFTNLPLH